MAAGLRGNGRAARYSSAAIDLPPHSIHIWEMDLTAISPGKTRTTGLPMGWIALGLGLLAGLAVGGDVIGWVVGLWRDYMLPAFIEINASGIPLCA